MSLETLLLNWLAWTCYIAQCGLLTACSQILWYIFWNLVCYCYLRDFSSEKLLIIIMLPKYTSFNSAFSQQLGLPYLCRPCFGFFWQFLTNFGKQFAKNMTQPWQHGTIMFQYILPSNLRNTVLVSWKLSCTPCPLH